MCNAHIPSFMVTKALPTLSDRQKRMESELMKLDMSYKLGIYRDCEEAYRECWEALNRVLKEIEFDRLCEVADRG
ncbi:MAG TPA: hypothetical protein DCR95_09880 [Desulfobacter sp.]|nr:hypothetical protein [Desulfobacter sp.]